MIVRYQQLIKSTSRQVKSYSTRYHIKEFVENVTEKTQKFINEQNTVVEKHILPKVSYMYIFTEKKLIVESIIGERPVLYIIHIYVYIYIM